MSLLSPSAGSTRLPDGADPSCGGPVVSPLSGEGVPRFCREVGAPPFCSPGDPAGCFGLCAGGRGEALRRVSRLGLDGGQNQPVRQESSACFVLTVEARRNGRRAGSTFGPGEPQQAGSPAPLSAHQAPLRSWRTRGGATGPPSPPSRVLVYDSCCSFVGSQCSGFAACSLFPAPLFEGRPDCLLFHTPHGLERPAAILRGGRRCPARGGRKETGGVEPLSPAAAWVPARLAPTPTAVAHLIDRLRTAGFKRPFPPNTPPRQRKESYSLYEQQPSR